MNPQGNHSPTWGGSDWNSTPDVNLLYLYDGWNLIAEMDASSTPIVARSYVWGLDLSGGIGGLLMANLGDGNTTQLIYYGYDGNGNVNSLADANGDLVGTYDYDAFGKVVQMTGVWAGYNPFRFATEYLEADATYGGTSLGVYNNKNRYYLPEVGRFANRDPYDEAGGLNLLAYCRNDGINAFDPFGLSTLRLFYNLATDINPPVGTINAGSWEEIANDIKNKIKQYKTCCVSELFVYGHGYDGAFYAGSERENKNNPRGDLVHDVFDKRRQTQKDPSKGEIFGKYTMQMISNIDQLYVIKSLMCVDGEVTLISCHSFKGEIGKEFKKELEGIYGVGKVHGFETDVWTGPYGSSTSPLPFAEFFSDIPVPSELTQQRLDTVMGASLGP